jgi:hypothetical protein
MPIQFCDLTAAPCSTLPENVVIVGPVQLLQEVVSTQEIFVTKNLLCANGLLMIQNIALRLKPSSERGASAETFLTINDQISQRIAVCAIPTGDLGCI